MHPSMLQICYLSELAKIGKRRGSVAESVTVRSAVFLRSASAQAILQTPTNLRKKEPRR